MNSSVMADLAHKYNVKATSGRIAFHYQLSQESIENVKKVVLETHQEALKNPYDGDDIVKFYNVGNQ